MNEYKVLISGNYNVFNEGWNGGGIYMCSGNYFCWLGSGAKPPNIGTSKTGLLNLMSFSNNDNGVIAQWIAQK